MILADLLAIMDRGRIEQVGTYEDIYAEPRNAFVAGFLNRHVGLPPISFLDLAGERVGVRPEDVRIARVERPDALPAVIEESVDLPLINATMLRLRVSGQELHAQGGAGARFRAGEPVWVTFARFHVFDASGARVATRSGPP
jgi:ABC-type sugar transport system ATPase subunit